MNWKPIPGYEGLYEISDTGLVKSLHRSNRRGSEYKIPGLAGPGYHQVQLTAHDSKKRMLYVHRLVAQSFLPNPENKNKVNHKNGIKTDNRIENLEWCTQKENIHHSIISGLRTKRCGEFLKRLKHPKAAQHITNLKPNT